MRRSLIALALMLVSVTAGCQSGSDPSPHSQAGDQSQAADEAARNGSAAPDGPPAVLLAKVYYNDLLLDEFAYGQDGKPSSLKHYHPVTGELSSELVPTKLSDAGQVIEATSKSGSTTEKVVYTYDPDGRRAAIERFDEGGTLTSRSTYEHAGNKINQKITAPGRPDRSIIYTLDGGGNVVSQRWIDDRGDQTHTFGDFDTEPNPYTLTAGIYDSYPLSRNNYRTDTTYAGCEFVSEQTYEDGLLVATTSTGCVNPSGEPTVHEYRYEYVSR